MALSPFLQILIPAVGAGLSGLGAHLLDGSAMTMIASASGGAFVAAMLSYKRPPETKPDTSPRGVVPVPTRAPETDSPILQAMEHLPFALLIIDRDRTIIAANRMASAMFSVRGDENQPDATLRTRRLLDRIDQVFADGKPGILNFTLSRMGDANLKAHLRPLDTGEIMIAIEDETRSQRAGAMHRDFVANASHELKTPLAAIAGVIETLLGHARHDPGATERFLGLLQAQALRMTRLVEDLLSLNRIELNERVLPEDQNDLISVIMEAVDALRPIAETDEIDIETDMPAARIMVLSDRDELGQLFGNLIDNAIKYGGNGTKVSIRTQPASAETDGMIAVEIRDQGPGIAREHIPRLTERFYRVNAGASRAKGGTGLGLAIVKHILSRHRGRLEIESSLGDGSCFRVLLPVEQQLENPRADATRADARRVRETTR